MTDLDVMDSVENEGDDALKRDFLDPLKAASKDLQAAGMFFMQNGMKNPNAALSGSYDFMHMMGHVCLGLMWARMARAAMAALEAGASDADFYKTKIATGRYYMARQLPMTATHLARIQSGADVVMTLPVAEIVMPLTGFGVHEVGDQRSGVTPEQGVAKRAVTPEHAGQMNLHEKHNEAVDQSIVHLGRLR